MRGIGVDIIEITRIQKSMDEYSEAFLQKLFTPSEIAYCLKFKKDAAAHVAGRFAAKEAIAKALGVGFGEHLKWLDIEILPGPLGEPIVTLSDSLKEKFHDPKIMLSISHSKESAVAFAIYL